MLKHNSVTPLPLFPWYLQLSAKLSLPACHLNATWHEWWQCVCYIHVVDTPISNCKRWPQVANVILMGGRVTNRLLLCSRLWHWCFGGNSHLIFGNEDVSPTFYLLHLLKHVLPSFSSWFPSPSPRCEGSVGGARWCLCYSGSRLPVRLLELHICSKTPTQTHIQTYTTLALLHLFLKCFDFVPAWNVLTSVIYFLELYTTSRLSDRSGEMAWHSLSYEMYGLTCVCGADFFPVDWFHHCTCFSVYAWTWQGDMICFSFL